MQYIKGFLAAVATVLFFSYITIGFTDSYGAYRRDQTCRYEIKALGLVYRSNMAPEISGCVVTFIDAGSEQERRIGGDFLVTKICPGDANY